MDYGVVVERERRGRSLGTSGGAELVIAKNRECPDTTIAEFKWRKNCHLQRERERERGGGGGCNKSWLTKQVVKQTL